MAQEKVSTIEKMVVIGGSAGSLDPLLQIVPQLRPDLKCPIVIVVHRKNTDSLLSELLASKTTLIVKEIEEKEKIRNGVIYIAPGDYHVLFESDHTFSLDYSEKVNYSRPSIDIVFQSAAAIFKEKLFGIILSGANADGTEGLKYIKEYGGTTIAQQATTAEIPYMPMYAITHQVIDYVLDATEIGSFINAL